MSSNFPVNGTVYVVSSSFSTVVSIGSIELFPDKLEAYGRKIS